MLDRTLPPGGITEIVGRPSSGRTSLFMACLGEATRRGAVAGLVDTDQTFDPASAVRAGVDLARLLWVRCGGRRDVALRAADLLVRCPGFTLVGLDLGELTPRPSLATIYRLKLAARRTGTSLVIVAGRRIAGSGAALAVETVRCGLDWTGPGPVPTRLARLGTEIHVRRRREGGAGGEAPGIAWWSP